MTPLVEERRTFACFGSTVTVLVTAEPLAAQRAVEHAHDRMLEWHDRFTRFEPGSELSVLNADHRETVPVSPDMARLASLVVLAGRLSGGLVDSTLVGELERAGYARDLGDTVPLRQALSIAPPRIPARGHSQPGATLISVDRAAGTVTRPRGLQIDSGGLAKGMFADILVEDLAHLPAFAIDCGGDVRIGGTLGQQRGVEVADPFGGAVVHTAPLTSGAVATSGIGKRAWLDAEGRPCHHLLDPSTGRPAFTGLVQVTAVAPTAAEGEIRAKAALLAGSERARDWLPHGGVVVSEDESAAVHQPLNDLSPAGAGLERRLQVSGFR